MVVASFFSDKLLNRKLFVWPFLLVGGLAFYASYLVGSSHFWISFALMVIAGGAMYAPYGPFFAIIPELLPRNVAGGAMALINSMGALGSFVGAYFVGFLNGATGGFSASYMFMAVSLVISVFFTIIVKGTKAVTSKDDDPIDIDKHVILGK
jgi:MFS family permease